MRGSRKVESSPKQVEPGGLSDINMYDVILADQHVRGVCPRVCLLGSKVTRYACFWPLPTKEGIRS